MIETKKSEAVLMICNFWTHFFELQNLLETKLKLYINTSKRLNNT